jgi:hypothetical protein
LAGYLPSSFLPKHTASHPEVHSTDTIYCESPKSSRTPYHSAPPPSATVTTGFTPFGASPFRVSKREFIIARHYRPCSTKVLRVGRHCVCFLELSPVRGPTSAPRVPDRGTRGAAGKSKYSENELSQHHFVHHKSHAVTWHLTVFFEVRGRRL